MHVVLCNTIDVFQLVIGCLSDSVGRTRECSIVYFLNTVLVQTPYTSYITVIIEKCVIIISFSPFCSIFSTFYLI